MRILKKAAILLMSIMMASTAFIASAADRKTSGFSVRDPYVLNYEGKYYMYGTGLAWPGYGCVVSEDLENWSQNYQVFKPSEDFEGTTDFWAPECHYYKGDFYLFATYRSKITNYRGVAIFKASSPLGPFEQITDGSITPKTRDCIDGTLYVDDDGCPWMIFVNEWTSNEGEIGTMAAAKMSDDLTRFISEPIELFAANKHAWTDGRVTDGPFLYKTKDGKLLMIWSNFADKKGYAVGMAVSSNGKIDGKWIHNPNPLYIKDKLNAYDGGHGMLFYDNEGQLTMAIHSPNSSDAEKGIHETATFIQIQDDGFELSIKREKTFFEKLLAVFRKIYIELAIIFCK